MKSDRGLYLYTITPIVCIHVYPHPHLPPHPTPPLEGFIGEINIYACTDAQPNPPQIF